MGGRSGALAGEARATARTGAGAGRSRRLRRPLLPGAFRRRAAARATGARALPGLGAGARGRPRYLLLDEPVSSLDIKHQLIIMDIARDYARRGGGVVAILHDLNLTAMYADQVM